MLPSTRSSSHRAQRSVKKAKAVKVPHRLQARAAFIRHSFSSLQSPVGRRVWCPFTKEPCRAFFEHPSSPVSLTPALLKDLRLRPWTPDEKAGLVPESDTKAHRDVKPPDSVAAAPLGALSSVQSPLAGHENDRRLESMFPSCVWSLRNAPHFAAATASKACFSGVDVVVAWHG